MAFAGGVPICESGSMRQVMIGVSSPLSELLTHHSASWVLSFKKICWRCGCSRLDWGYQALASFVESHLGNLCCSSQFVGQRSEHGAATGAGAPPNCIVQTQGSPGLETSNCRVLSRRTNGPTCLAGNNFARCFMACKVLAQWCAPSLASMATSDCWRLAKKTLTLSA